jgi:hypothetical protein
MYIQQWKSLCVSLTDRSLFCIVIFGDSTHSICERAIAVVIWTEKCKTTLYMLKIWTCWIILMSVFKEGATTHAKPLLAKIRLCIEVKLHAFWNVCTGWSWKVVPPPAIAKITSELIGLEARASQDEECDEKSFQKDCCYCWTSDDRV